MSSVLYNRCSKTIFTKLCVVQNAPFFTTAVRTKFKEVDLPPISGKFRRIVHYEEKYTVKPLQVTNLGGRDPVSGRIVVKGLGGGIKHKYHWIQWIREGPTEGPPLVEKVIQIMDCGCRTAKIALVGSGEQMKYILATENMKAGDLIRTSLHIPRNSVAAKEGDAYPLGALPIGTIVNNIEGLPSTGGYYVHAAGTSAKIVRKSGERAIIQLPSKHEVSLSQHCMATVGRLSNVIHNQIPIGSAGRNRELGNRPRSGLWQRKTGRHGRVIRPLPPVKVREPDNKEVPEILTLTLDMDWRRDQQV